MPSDGTWRISTDGSDQDGYSVVFLYQDGTRCPIEMAASIHRGASDWHRTVKRNGMNVGMLEDGHPITDQEWNEPQKRKVV